MICYMSYTVTKEFSQLLERSKLIKRNKYKQFLTGVWNVKIYSLTLPTPISFHTIWLLNNKINFKNDFMDINIFGHNIVSVNAGFINHLNDPQNIIYRRSKIDNKLTLVFVFPSKYTEEIRFIDDNTVTYTSYNENNDIFDYGIKYRQRE